MSEDISNTSGGERVQVQDIPRKHLVARHHELNTPNDHMRRISPLGQGWSQKLGENVTTSKGFKMCFLVVSSIGAEKIVTHAMPTRGSLKSSRAQLDQILDGTKPDKVSVVYNPDPYNYNAGKQYREQELRLLESNLLEGIVDINTVNFVPIERPSNVEDRDFDIVADRDNLTIWRSGTLECNNIFDMHEL